MDFNETSSKIIIIAVVVLTGLIVFGAVVWGTQSSVAPPTVNMADIKISGAPSIGQAGAPVTIAVWSDYQCPACKSFELNSLPQIVTDYVDTGKVRIVFMDFQFLGEDSKTAALYSRSVWKLYPEQYVSWRTAMYIAQDQEQDIGFGDAPSIDKLHGTIPGLDVTKIAADVKENATLYQSMADSDRTEGQKAGVNSTPSFVIGDQLFVGAFPFTSTDSQKNFKDIIEALLK